MITRQIIKNGVEPFVFPYSTKISRVSSSQIADNGSLKRMSVIEEYDCTVDDKQFSFRDFSITNIIALGNENLLNPVQMQESKSAGIENLAKFNHNVQEAVQKAQEGSGKCSVGSI